MNDLAIWRGDIYDEYAPQVAHQLDYIIDRSLLFCDPATIPDEAREAVQQFEAAFIARVVEVCQEQVTYWTGLLARATHKEAERAAVWSPVKTFADLREIGPQIVSGDSDSQERQLRAFWNTHLQTIEQSGANVGAVIDGLSRSPKMAETLARVVSRVSSSDLTQDEKDATIRQAVSDANTEASAAAFGQKYLNGKVSVPFDEIQLKDGTRLVTAVCSTSEQYIALSKAIKHIKVIYGNVEPILLEWMKGKK